MKAFHRFFLYLIVAWLPMKGSMAQDKDIVLSAMKDELDRNMKELQQPNFDKPFFIAYGILDQKTYSLSATLGSLVQSIESPQRLKTTTRILVGDYSFNDESLEDNLFSSPSAADISLPLDDDYNGIRRAFWSTTDKVYRDAARHFQKHKETMAELNKKLEDVPHRSFAKCPPVSMVTNSAVHGFDKAKWESVARELSSLFLKHQSISNSFVSLNFTEGHKYLVNSEGTIAKIPLGFAYFTCMAQRKDEEGEFFMDQLVHRENSMENLPSTETIRGEIETMIARLERLHTVPKFLEQYSGPVLLAGPVVAEVFSASFFNGRESVVARDNIAKLSGFQYDPDVLSMDGKLGKNICSELITVKARPLMKSFQGTGLLGSFELDDEGVVPVDPLVIVEGGVLKALLNNRTITEKGQVANGFSSGPGVVEVSIQSKETEKALKEKLLAQARKEGLDFALIVRDNSKFRMGLIDVYKVSVKDGSEELMRNAMLGSMNLKMLKRLMGASEKYQAHNIGGINSGVGTSPITSFIVPESILVEEMEILPFRMPTLKEEEFVPSPLKSVN